MLIWEAMKRQEPAGNTFPRFGTFWELRSSDEGVRRFSTKLSFQRVKQRKDSEALSPRKDIIADIINVGIEELVHHRYELPAFSNLVSAARKARLEVNRGFYQDVTQSLSEEHKAMIRELMSYEKEESISSWQCLKREPKRVTVKNMRECIKHLHWLKSNYVTSEAMNAIPEAKFQRFASEAFSLNVNEMNDLPEAKRYTLATALVRTQTAGGRLCVTKAPRLPLMI